LGTQAEAIRCDNAMNVTIDTGQATPFWPTPRLWLKSMIAAIYIPFLVNLLVISLIGGMFGNRLLGFLFFATLLGGPISVGLLLARSSYGLIAGIAALVLMSLVWYLGSLLIQDVYQTFAGDLQQTLGMRAILTLQDIFDFSLPLVLTAFSGVSIIELITGDVTNATGFRALAGGLLLGLILACLYSFFFSITYSHGPRANDLFLFAWSAHFALVWLSTFFFNELITRRVGWGGVLVGAGWIGLVFGVSYLVIT
jgi:hypothetical protein